MGDRGPLFNLSPEKIKISPNFDQSTFIPIKTTIKGPSSSKGS